MARVQGMHGSSSPKHVRPEPDAKSDKPDGYRVSKHRTSVRAGGTGGPSNAGMFTVKEKTGDKLVLEIMGAEYGFSKKK